MTIRESLVQLRHSLKNADIKSYELDAELIIAHATNKNRAWVLAHQEIELSKLQSKEVAHFLDARLQHAPLAYLFEQSQFYGLNLYVNKDVLIPRPESETIVEYTVKHAPKNVALLDIGTGSGALAVAIKKHRPDIRVHASDISESALDVARMNAQSQEVDINFLMSDLLGGIDVQLEWIVANLPYVPSETDLNDSAKHEPKVALLAEREGLDLFLTFFDQLENAKFKTVNTVVIEANPDQHFPLQKSIKNWEMERLSYFVSVFTCISS